MREALQLKKVVGAPLELFVRSDPVAPPQQTQQRVESVRCKDDEASNNEDEGETEYTK